MFVLENSRSLSELLIGWLLIQRLHSPSSVELFVAEVCYNMYSVFRVLLLRAFSLFPGKPIFPIVLGGLTVHSLGEVSSRLMPRDL